MQLGEIFVKGIGHFLKTIQLVIGEHRVELKAPEDLATDVTFTFPGTAKAGILSSDATGNLSILEKSPASVFRKSFVAADLTGGVLTLTHNLGSQIVKVQISDGANEVLLPDKIVLTSNSAATVTLTSYGAITGTWNAIAIS